MTNRDSKTPQAGRLTAAEDLLWLCNATDHERCDTHDYCLVHEVSFPSDEPCPETLRRLAQVRAGALTHTGATEGALAEYLAAALEPYGMQDCAAITARAVVHSGQSVDEWADDWDVRPLIERRLAQAWSDGWTARDDHDWNGLSITPSDCAVANPHAGGPCVGLPYGSRSEAAAVMPPIDEATHVYVCAYSHWHVGLGE